jgi:hypothetical protein
LWFFGGSEVWRLCFFVGAEGLVLVLLEGLRFGGYFLCRVFLSWGV